MQVKFSTFIIALSFLNYFFGVAISSPIPGPGGGSPRSNSSPHKTIVIKYPNPNPKPYVHDKPYPMAPEPVLTRKEWHQERVEKLTEHLGEIKKERQGYHKAAVQALGKGKIGRAAKEVGKACIMGVVCNGVHMAKAIHTVKANNAR
jgi:hypothetical protein